MALAFATMNRVSFSHLTDESTIKASDLPLSTFLPTLEDLAIIYDHMVIMVKRIAKRYFTYFKECNVPEHILHEYSVEMAMKSVVVCIIKIQ